MEAHPNRQIVYLSNVDIEQRSGLRHETIFRPGGAAEAANKMGLISFEGPGERNGWVDGHALAGSWTLGHGRIEPVTVLAKMHPKMRALVEEFLALDNPLWSPKQLGHNGWRLAATLIARCGIIPKDILITAADVARIIGTSTRRAYALLAKPEAEFLVRSSTQNYPWEAFLVDLDTRERLYGVPLKRGQYLVRLWSRVFSPASPCGGFGYEFKDEWERSYYHPTKRDAAIMDRLFAFYDYKTSPQEEVYDSDLDPDNLIPPDDEAEDDDGDEAYYPRAWVEALAAEIDAFNWCWDTPEPAQGRSAVLIAL